jgi:hypothetical protein
MEKKTAWCEFFSSSAGSNLRSLNWKGDEEERESMYVG